MTREYKRIFSQIEYLMQIWENSVVGNALIDPDHNFIACNETYAKIFEQSREEVLGKSWVDLTDETDKKRDLYLAEGTKNGSIPGYILRKKYVPHPNQVIEVLIIVKPIFRVASSEEESTEFLCFHTLCIPLSVMLQQSDFLLPQDPQFHYRPGNLPDTPIILQSKPQERIDLTLSRTYRIIAIVLGAGTLMTGLATILYWLVHLFDFLTKGMEA